MNQTGPVVVLAGGTGGAKLARGMLDVVGSDQLMVIANTADDIEIYGAYVSPDPDLVTFWLADLIDDRGWELQGDTFHVMDGLRALGVDVWFNVGDRDLAIGLERARALDQGTLLTDAHGAIARALGVRASVLPMSDNPVRTRIGAQGRTWPFQEFMIKVRAQGPIGDIDFAGIKAAHATPQVLNAIASARAIVIGPSNPVISVAPILAVPGVCEALKTAAAPVVAISPLVQGEVVKGPTAVFMEWAGQPLTSDGVAALYDGVIDGFVADQPTDLVPTLRTGVLMDSADTRRRLAEETLEYATRLR